MTDTVMTAEEAIEHSYRLALSFKAGPADFHRTNIALLKAKMMEMGPADLARAESTIAGLEEQITQFAHGA